MVKTRKGQTNSTTMEVEVMHTRPPRNLDILDELIEDMSQHNKQFDILVPLSDKIEKMKSKLRGSSFILVGSASGGKESHLAWLTHLENSNPERPEIATITINCLTAETDTLFLQCLTRQMRAFLGEGVISKHIVINETTLNLQGLNKEFEKTRKKELLLIIKNADVLAFQRRKQRVLYNLFEWLNSDVKKYITVVFVTRKMTFVDKLEKRTKSRMNLPILYIPKYKPQDIIAIITRRIEYRIEESGPEGKSLNKLIKALEHKEFLKVIQEQHQFCPRDVVCYLNIMRLLITLDIQSPLILMQKSQEQINNLIQDKFPKYFQYTADHKMIGKNLFINLSLPQVFLMGLIRYRLMNQQGRFREEITANGLNTDYTNLLSKKRVDNAMTFFFSAPLLSESILKLEELGFIKIIKMENVDFRTRNIQSQFSPEDIYAFFKVYCEQSEGVPSFVKDVFNSQILYE